MVRAVILDTLKKLTNNDEIEVCYFLRKNGDILGTAGKDEFRQIETFGIMCATIFGAANTANEQLKKDRPNRIVIRSADGDTVIKGVMDDFILALRTHERENFGMILKKMDNAIEHIEENWS